ncbi:MAG: universal stress protein [Telluria sp.]|nr:universal stress protein [Telluria sp.]
MSYKTILVHVDRSRQAPERIRMAARLALAQDAHLIGAAMSGISRFVYQDSSIDLTRTIVAGHIDALYQEARAALAQFDAIAGAMGVLSREARLVDDEPEGALALQARYADLVVLSQADPEDPVARIAAALPAYVMLHSTRPVLLVPYAGSFDQVGTHALVAWDAGMEATRAVTSAIPLLRRADAVSVVLFNSSAEHGEQPGADIALYLARHGVRVELHEQRTEIDIGSSLLSMAADLRADLLVMGCYGHARVREVLLGGVTQTILGAMTVPVLMCH